MIFFGWGTKSKEWNTDGQYNLTATWSYFHIFWCPIGFNSKRYLLGDKRSEDRLLTRQEVKEMFPENTPSIPLRNRFGLLFVFVAIFGLPILFTLVSLVINSVK